MGWVLEFSFRSGPEKYDNFVIVITRRRCLWSQTGIKTSISKWNYVNNV